MTELTVEEFSKVAKAMRIVLATREKEGDIVGHAIGPAIEEILRENDPSTNSSASKEMLALALTSLFESEGKSIREQLAMPEDTRNGYVDSARHESRQLIGGARLSKLVETLRAGLGVLGEEFQKAVPPLPALAR